MRMSARGIEVIGIEVQVTVRAVAPTRCAA